MSACDDTTYLATKYYSSFHSANKLIILSVVVMFLVPIIISYTYRQVKRVLKYNKINDKINIENSMNDIIQTKIN